MSNLTDLMRAEAEVLRLKSYRQIDDEAAVDLIHETRERALKAEAEVAALKRVVAAADAMRDRYLACSHSIDCDTPWSVTQYDAARAALKEGK